MNRRLRMFGVVIVAALSGSGAPHAQPPSTNQRVWTGTWEERDSWEGSSTVGRSQAQITFVYQEGLDESGQRRWASRRLTWSARWEEQQFDRLVLEKVGATDERGTIQNRYPMDILTICEGGGTLELGPAPAGTGDDLTTAQKEQLRPSCVTTFQPRDSAVPAPAPTLSTRDALRAPGMPNEEELTGCTYEKAWSGRPSGSMSVSVSAPVTAIMEVSRRADEPYARFVPEPGATLTFTASVPAGTARFRFELDPEATSRFPGYATNADIDAAFFAKYKVVSQNGQYQNDGPDVIFDSAHFKREEWSRVEPLVVETARPQSAAVVTVTTMDYGAVGRLRAFVRSEECGDWQPIPIKFYPDTREFITIPMDEDNNLMADALDDYKGRQSGADDDDEPKGNGMAGDGLTVFEEYRGFLTSTGDCPNRDVDRHVRTKPKIKDLFVHTPDADMEMVLEHTAWASGLNVHAICEHHYSGNPDVNWLTGRNGDLGTRAADRMRIVNMTLQFAGLREWQNHVVSQAVPQHGLYLVNRALEDVGGCSFGDRVPECADTLIGPPMVTSVIAVDKESNGKLLSLVSSVTHEIGHSVGLPHHGQRIDAWNLETVKGNIKKGIYILIVSPGGDCVEPREGVKTEFNYFFSKGTFVGCASPQIVVRNGENSGNAECPMRYSFARSSFREAPGTTAGRPNSATADEEQSWSGARRRIGFDKQVSLYSSRFLKYDNSLDQEALGRFCTVKTGTGLNGLSGDGNHAGDSQVDCMSQLVVNDNVLRGIR